MIRKKEECALIWEKKVNLNYRYSYGEGIFFEQGLFQSIICFNLVKNQKNYNLLKALEEAGQNAK